MFLELIVALTVCFCPASSIESCPNHDADVLILGGGMAGISAAKTLSDNGVGDFIILEATGKLGGRMRTADIAGVKVEFGANWIQEIDRNNPGAHPIVALSERCGRKDGSGGPLKGRYSNYESLSLYDQNGMDITNNSAFLAAFEHFYDSRNIVDMIDRNRRQNNEPDISLRDALQMSDWNPATSVEDWIEWFKVDFCAAVPPEDISLFEYGFLEPDYLDFFVTDQRGYSWVVECLADDFRGNETNGDERIHLGATVTQINWGDSCVCVTAVENDMENRFCAEYAILTFSLGVLQSDNFNENIVPSLPQWKIDVINQFDYVHFLKIFLEFNHTFWGDMEMEFIARVDNVRGHYPLFLPLDMFLPNNVSVILAIVTGELADRIVRQPLETTKDEIVEVLKLIYGNDVPEPVNIVVSDWRLNPLFLGTYSNAPVGVSDDSYKKLADPVGRLYFSGEATNREHYGYVHAAYYAGIDSAMAVLSSTPMFACETALTIFFVIISLCTV